MNLYLQEIVESFSLNNLPADWLGIDFAKFSEGKTLFAYQQKALEHALKALYWYFEEYKGDKKFFYRHYQNNGLAEDFGYNLKKDSKAKRYLLEYDKEFGVKSDKISFEHFINRMSFWMATGSGKTLVIVKLIELLGYLIENGNIPKKDILFLTHRDDLIEQFRRHVEMFNRANSSIYINLVELRAYESHKNRLGLSFGKSVDVYFYRSDLIADEQKEKIVSYKNYDNGGNWYVILDEAHKGDREESKRQILYAILSRNGFMFNFSATFTDERDYATCAFNFNLARFIESGYGKHIYVSKESITALEEKREEIASEKQKILLRLFILQSALNKQCEEIKKQDSALYHKPLLLALVNSVNTEDSDLELFFKEIEKIASGQLDNELFEKAKEEIIKELCSEKATLEFEEKSIDRKIISIIEGLKAEEILRYVFNAKTAGKIEVLKIPSNKQELIFKLTTSERAFALMKIGDISEWIKNKLTGYEINERFEDESLFKSINESEDINILMGSRSFYEGWDSNRPNMILFIDIGKGKDSRKFVLQSIGRGVRIEPMPNKRKRVVFLYNNREIEPTLYEAIQDKVEALETLFVFGTKAENLKEVISTLKQEKPEVWLGDLFEVNPAVKDKLLLIPTYQEADRLLAEEREVVKYQIHSEDYEAVRSYLDFIDDKVAVCKFDVNVKVLQKVKEAFNGKKDAFFLETEEMFSIQKPELLLRNIFRHFSQRVKEFDKLKALEDEIIHFKRISVSADKLNALREKIERVKESQHKDKRIAELKEKQKKGEIDINEYTSQIQAIENHLKKKDEVIYSANERLSIRYLANHYYIPILLTESERLSFIQHIIRHKSEVNFVNELEDYLSRDGNVFQQFDWWYFSKIDETLDEIYIPYYNPKTNRMDRFKPDFIFWLCKGERYMILFVDPKGTEHADGYRKIDGYTRAFEVNSTVREFLHDGFKVTVGLLLKGRIENVLEHYKKYWFDSFTEFSKKILQFSTILSVSTFEDGKGHEAEVRSKSDEV